MNRIPAMKNRAPQTSATSMVWPKSGCSTRMPTTPISSSRQKVVAGTSNLREDSANSQETSTTKEGLRNSEGWMLTPASTIQRRAPLISTPTKRVATTIAALMMKTTSATRRR